MRRRRFAFVVVFVALAGPSGRPRAQGPTMADVLGSAAAYLADFQKQLSGIVAEETYTQQIVRQHGASSILERPSRTLRSDLLLVKPSGADRYVEYRDVFEVDGHPVRERADRLGQLLRQPWASASSQLSAIISASARYNIGDIQRNVNTPLLALLFLDAGLQTRFEFKRASKAREPLDPRRVSAPEQPGVFRVATEMWTIEYREKKPPTLIRTPSGKGQPARGRFWINPTTGAVLMTELVVNGGGVTATISVSYQSEPLQGFLVPVAMTESYLAAREHVVGTATYGRFRQLSVPEP